MHSIFTQTDENPIIAAVRSSALVDVALRSNIKTIFMMGGTLSEARDITRRVHDAGKNILFHVELLKGLGRDREGIEYLARDVGPDGVVSTKPHLLNAVRDMDLLCILQIFMIDTQAYLSGTKNIKSIKPDAVEIMPGLMPGIVKKLTKRFDLPIFSAGLISRPEEVKIMLDAGVCGLAISEQNLWNYPE